MQEIFPKKKRGRPTNAERLERQKAEQQEAQVKDDLNGGMLTDDDYFEQQFAKRATGRRSVILECNDEMLEKLFRLGRLACTQQEAAAFIGVSLRTLQNFLYANSEAMEAWQDGLDNAKVSLRRKQFNLADKNAPMAIFLGKNLLGQKDENHNVVTHNKPATELTEDDLAKIIEKGQQMEAAQSEKPKSGKVH